MGYDRFFGFNLQQRKTLQVLLDEVASGDSETLTQLQEDLTALEGRVDDLENP